ncbi:MAG: hypothetical protein JXA61_04305 [Bacteroidales bacterium]|nr:hypothetical protein [Bacteroidales bacterium]
MKKSFLPWLIVMIITCINVNAQRNANVGIFGGTAYYLGDINPSRHFYRPSLSLGGLYRLNINTRYAIRLNAYYISLSGSDLDFPADFHPDRPFNPQFFNTSLIDAALQAEFNFLPYEPNQVRWDYTPYIATGLAGALVVQTDRDASNFVSLPFSIGIKTTFSKKLSGGAEWSFRKTFNDRIDGYENPSDTYSIIHNNDWYSYLGIFITYKFFNFAVDCPAYD